jgi:hypothetical protein
MPDLTVAYRGPCQGDFERAQICDRRQNWEFERRMGDFWNCFVPFASVMRKDLSMFEIMCTRFRILLNANDMGETKALPKLDSGILSICHQNIARCI